MLRRIALLAGLAAVPALSHVPVASAVVTVCPTAETAPAHNAGDAADDSAIWIHPTNPLLSLVIGTEKLAAGGLDRYDLSGAELLPPNADGALNNDDVRYNFPLGLERVDLLGASNRNAKTLDFYRINAADRSLTKVGSVLVSLAIVTPRGFALYHSPVSGKYYAFVTDSGKTEQYELDGSSGQVRGRFVRRLQDTPVLHSEGLVADDELGRVYLAEEDIGGIWRFGAEPTDPMTGTKIARTTEDPITPGPIIQDTKGLTMYYASNGGGYLIAISQSGNSFHVFNRGDNGYVGEFKIAPRTVNEVCIGSNGKPIDAVTGMDGADVTNFNLGSQFPQGVFVSQDTTNDSANQNHKLVPWQSIANAFNPPLIVDTTFDPRKIGSPGGPGTILPGLGGIVTAAPGTIVPPTVAPPKPPIGTISVRRLSARRIRVRITLALGSASDSTKQCAALVGALNWATCKIVAGRVSFARVVTPSRATIAVAVRLNRVLAFTRRFNIPKRVGRTTLTRVPLRIARPRL